MRGQRYEIDLEEPTLVSGEVSKPSLLRNIEERTCSDAEPVPPNVSVSSTGFPAHTKKRLSRFKRQGLRVDDERIPLSQSQHGNYTNTMSASRECNDISEENNKRLASMSEAEIMREQQELKSHLSPTLIENLMKRANRNNNHGNFKSVEKDASTNPDHPNATTGISPTENSVKEGPVGPQSTPIFPQSEASRQSLDRSKADTENISPPLAINIHFPKPPQPPDLDLNDPDFNQKLHSTYFPALPADPSGLSWMEPASEEERAEYSPALETYAASSLRFDFKGRLLPPRLAAQIPVTKGLHHHGDAPESAGYTIPELARLARSVIPGQRCIAYQTLGRILYRLGQGQYGQEGDDLYEGLWQSVEKSKALDEIIQVAARDNEGHRSVWAYAIDAVHLWRKGGGKRWQGR